MMSNTGEVIRFSMEFQVTKGKKETGYVDGIRIKSSTHNIVIRTGSVHLA